jgi:hypothetical protein
MGSAWANTSSTTHTDLTPETLSYRIEGQVTPHTAKELKRWLEQVNAQQRFSGPVTVYLNSLGGDGIAGMQIGRLLRQAKAHTIVDGQCASACFYIFLGGVVRSAQGGQLGFHAAQVKKKIRLFHVFEFEYIPDLATDPIAKRLLNEGNAQLRKFLSLMCVEKTLVEMMAETPPQQLRWLNHQELLEFGVLTDQAKDCF